VTGVAVGPVAEGDADEGGHEAAHDDPDENVDLRKIGLKLVAGVGPDAHEGAGSEREKPGISPEQVEPDRRQRQDQEGDHHGVEEELIAERRDRDEGDEEDQREAVAVLADRKDRHVGRVGRLVLTGFAIEHGLAPRLGADL